MSEIAFIFPGQGSQKTGMLSELIKSELIVRDTFTEASDLLGFDLPELLQPEFGDKLNLTQNTQPVLLTSSVALWRLWKQRTARRPVVMAGHSLGEYSALVCADALSFENALSLVRKRGQYMQESVPSGTGAMAAVIGLADSEVIRLCEEISRDSGRVLSAANFNAPGQVVIAGHYETVRESVSLFKAAGAGKVVELPVSVPSHCALMKPAAESLRQVLNGISFQSPQIPVIQNITSGIEREPSAIRENLIRQLQGSVRWVESINTVINMGINTFYECGPGKVLAGLNKRIDKNSKVVALDTSEAFETAHA